MMVAQVDATVSQGLGPLVNEQAIKKAKRRRHEGSNMTSHNSTGFGHSVCQSSGRWEMSVERKTQAKQGNSRLVGSTETYGMGPPLGDRSAARLSWCYSAVLRPAKRV